MACRIIGEGMNALRQQVLEEIPRQLLEFMHANDITPNTTMHNAAASSAGAAASSAGASTGASGAAGASAGASTGASGAASAGASAGAGEGGFHLPPPRQKVDWSEEE